METQKSSSLTHRKNAKITGVFFIAATLFAILGLKLYDPILQNTNYIAEAAGHSTQIILGAVSELILVCANIGTAIMLFPYLKKYNENLARGYYTFRLVEAITILIGVVSMLSLLSLSKTFNGDANAMLSIYQPAASIVNAIHYWTFIIGPLFMLGINTTIYSSVLYRSKLVPVKLAVLGITGAVLVFISAILVMFGMIPMMSAVQILFAMPIAVYEMVLAGWLIAKGFNLENAGNGF